jgi:hypothetical protein
VWPQATSGTVSLSRAQLSMLCEGIVDGDDHEKPHCYFLAEQSTAATQRLTSPAN